MNSSGKYPCNICQNLEILEEHHINGRNIPNFNKKWNIANICPNCHTKIHKSLIIIEKWLETTEGRTLIFHKIGEKAITDEIATPFTYK